MALERFRARQAAREGEGTERFLRGMAMAVEAQPVVLEPPELDLPVLRVETTAGYQPGWDQIVGFVLEQTPTGAARHGLPLPSSGAMLADLVRQLADELRVVADTGLYWNRDDPYDRDRYEHVRRLAARLFALADERQPEEIERSVFQGLTHLAPVPVADAAIFDDQDRILLIRRADDGLWAMPGGAYDMGEAPAEGAAREAREETGLVVEVEDLVGVYDSRFCGTRSSLQLFQFVFACRVTDEGRPTTPHEVTGMGWFAEKELPPLSPGHTVRVPNAFEFRRNRRPFFDEIPSGSTPPGGRPQRESGD